MKKTILYLLAGGIMCSMITLVSCDDDDKSLPKIDGYNNSNEVAEENLVAHWPFDNTNKERISSTDASDDFGTVGFEDGQIGEALKLTQGALVYPSITAINGENSLASFTVSLWVKVKNTKKTASPYATAFFSLAYSDDTDIWGNINMLAETAWHLPSSDTLVLKPLFKTLLEEGTALHDNISTENGEVGAHFMGANRWAHFVATWNGTTHMFEIYGDGEKVGGYSNRGDGAPPLKMRTPVQAVFGSLAYSDIGFEDAPAERGIPMATASIDDVRVFNTVLSEAEITALFNLGVAGR